MRKGYMRITKRMKSKKGNCYLGSTAGWEEFKDPFAGENNIVKFNKGKRPNVRQTTKVSKNRDDK